MKSMNLKTLKMRTITYKLLFLLALLPSIIFAKNSPVSGEKNGRHTKQKKVSKQFNVSANDLLKINNSYGNIDITTWDKNIVSIEVLIKTNGDDEDKVRQKLEDIRIEFNQSSSYVSAKTYFSKNENNSWWDILFGNSNNVNMEVNYIIKAPITNNIDISNDYGNIYLDKLTGDSKISCDYGTIDIGELRGNSNRISFDYSRNSHFGFVNKAVISADYSEFTIDDANSIDLSADYTNSQFNKVELLKFSCDYGSLTVGKVKRVSGSGDYLSTKIGQIHQNAALNFDYGSVSIDKVVKGAGDISLNTDYTGVKIGYASDQAFNFDVNTSYGEVKGLNNFEIRKQNSSSSDKSFSGYYLNANSSSNIRVKASYGSVSFRKN